MKKTILLSGLMMALLVLLLKWIDYRLFLREISMEIYVGIIALICTALGIWTGLRLTRPKVIIQKELVDSFTLDPSKLKSSGISDREYEVLQLMAQGLSNQEIADQLFISLNTVKTHASKLFSKLDVKRRTQAIQKAKTSGLLP